MDRDLQTDWNVDKYALENELMHEKDHKKHIRRDLIDYFHLKKQTIDEQYKLIFKLLYKFRGMH